MNKVLVTGGAGFIGFHTATALLTRGDSVVIVDNFNDYYDPQLKRDRISKLKEHPQANNLVIKELDITDYLSLEAIFIEHSFDTVFSAAAQAGVRYSIENPFSYERSNLLGFLNVLELMRVHKVKNLVYASSSSVYGANTKTPFAESDKTDRPISLYAATKKANELMAHSYHHLYGINCTGLRFFTVYGPWSRPDMAMLKFAQKIANRESIDIYNQGEMKRDFTYVDDIVSGILSAIDHAYPFEVFNLAYGKSVQLLEYVEALEAELGIKAIRNLMPIQPGDVLVTDADISHAKEKLNYNPKTAVREGVAEFAKWFKEYYGIGG